MKKILVLSGYGVTLRARKGLFQIVEKGKKTAEISPVDIEAIVVATKAASITSSAVILASKLGIDMVFLDNWLPVSRLIPATYGSTLKTWVKQMLAVRRRRLEYARAFAEGKVFNQRMILYNLYKRYRGSRAETRIIRARIKDSIDSATLALRQIREAERVEQVRSAEAHAAKEYWKAVSKAIPKELRFRQRIKKYTLPKGEEPDPFNKALNIGYAALLRETWRAAFIAGLNPYYGFLHARRPGRMSLVLDLMEEFRPIAVDRPLINLARKEIGIFMKLKEDDKEAVARVWKVVVETLSKEPKPLKDIILQQARKLTSSIIEKRPYTPYKSSW